jgi:DNA-binding MarR family transcriptional regulator
VVPTDPEPTSIDPSSIDPSSIDLATLASLTGSGVTRLLLERLAEAGHPGVRASHGYVVQRLVEGEPTIGALAASLGITQQGASKQVGELEQLGYAERVAADGDARSRRVRLTAAGRAVVAAGRAERARLEAEVVARVGEDTVRAAKKALSALLELAGLDDRIRTRSVPLPPG